MPVAGLPFIALEFHGKGDRMFEGSADDRVLGKRGAFLTGAGWSRADYARFATKAEARRLRAASDREPGRTYPDVKERDSAQSR